MRALKIVGIVVAALAGLVVLGIGAILLLVDPNDYRDDIAKLVHEQTGRPFEIRGKLDLKVFPWLALGVHDVTLGNPPGFAGEAFLTVQNASVGVKLLPLLRKQVQVSRVAVNGLAMTLVSRGENDNNWKDLGESSSTSESSGPSPATTIAGIDVENSVLVYRDEEEKSVLRLSGLQLHTGALGSDEPVDAKIAFDYDEGAAPTIAHLEAKASVQVSAEGSRLEVKDLDANGKWYGSPDDGTAETAAAGTKAASTAAAAQPAGDPLPFSIAAPLLVLDLDDETLAPATLDAKLGELPVKLTAKGDQLFGDYVVSGKAVIERTAPRKLMESFGMKPPVTRDPKALSSFALTSEYQLTEKQLRLPAIDLALDETRVRGSASIDDLDAMALRFDLNVNAINLDRYLEPEKEEGKAGQVKVSSTAAQPPTGLPLDALRGLNARGQLRVGRATVANLDFTDIRLPLQAKDGRAHLGPTQARLFGGSYNGDIVLDAKPAQARLSMNEHVRGIDIGTLMKAGFDTDRVAGRGNASAQLSATGNTDAALFKTLAGKIDFDVKNGAVNGVDLWYELRRALALFKRQAPPARASGPPKTAFNALSGSAVLKDGVMRSDDLIADMTYIRATGAGTLALESQAIDYRLVTTVYKLPSDETGSEMADLRAAEIPVTITGTLADMKVRPDVEGYLKSRFKKKVDEKVEEKKEDLKKKLGDKLKGLLGH